MPYHIMYVSYYVSQFRVLTPKCPVVYVVCLINVR